MSGTSAGSKKAALTMTKRYGANYYARIGRVGGQRGHTGGFYANKELARTAGARGGALGKPYTRKSRPRKPLFSILSKLIRRNNYGR